MRALSDFFNRDALDIAPLLLGQTLVRRYDDGSEVRFTISEIEVYRGEEDLGCHASKGRTPRTEVMYHAGGKVYVYLIYGMYWLLNIVTGQEGHPQAILIRGCNELSGPGRLGKALQLDKSFYGEDMVISQRLWIELNPSLPPQPFETSPRIGIDYAGQHWGNIHWRFSLIKGSNRGKLNQ